MVREMDRFIPSATISSLSRMLLDYETLLDVDSTKKKEKKRKREKTPKLVSLHR